MFKVTKVTNQIDYRFHKINEEEKSTIVLGTKEFYSNLVKQLKEHKLDHHEWILFLGRWCDTNLSGSVELLMNIESIAPNARATTIYPTLRFEKDVDLVAFKLRWV